MTSDPRIPSGRVRANEEPAARSGLPLESLAEIARASVMAEEPEVAAQRGLAALCRGLGHEAGAVLGLRPDGTRIVLLAGYPPGAGPADATGRHFPRGGTLVDRVLAEGHTLRAPADGAWRSDPLVRALAAGRTLRDLTAVPLQTAGIDAGVLLLLNRPAGEAAGEEAGAGVSDESTVRSIAASHMALLVHRWQLRLARKAELDRIEAFNAVLKVTAGAFDERRLVDHVMEALLAASPADRAELVTLEGEDEARLRYHRGSGAGPAVAERLRRADVDPLHDRAWRSAEPVDGSRIGGPRRAHTQARPFVVCVPLTVRGRVVGSILLARHARPYERIETELLAAVGRQLGYALEHARLLRRATAEAEPRPAWEQPASGPQPRRKLMRERARWLASLGEMAAGVAHDLNNALHPIVAFAEIIREQADEPIRLYAERILMAARDGAETVGRIHRFTRRAEEPMPEALPLQKLVREALELSRPWWGERASAGKLEIVEAVDPAIQVLGHPGELRQALLNLIANALDAMPHRGVLRLVGRNEGERALLGVQDTGVGMPPEILRQAAEPFFTTKGSRGTGLGLSEVLGIARRQGGGAEILSWPGVGTTVLLQIVAAGTPAPAPRRPARQRKVRSEGAPSRVLLVDDSVLGLEAMATAMRQAGHSVVTASTAAAALAAFAPGQFDLVVTDIRMPDLGGFELMDRLRALDPSVRIGVVTGWPIHRDDEELNRRQVEIVLLKPVDPEDLLAAVEKAPAGGL